MTSPKPPNWLRHHPHRVNAEAPHPGAMGRRHGAERLGGGTARPAAVRLILATNFNLLTKTVNGTR
jgi:hypothetical protein